jgi:hypothetical protein
MGRIRREKDKHNTGFYVEIHCSYFVEKHFKFEHVMKVVVSVVNFIQSHGLNHPQFQYILVGN